MMALDIDPAQDPDAREFLDPAGQTAWDSWSTGPDVILMAYFAFRAEFIASKALNSASDAMQSASATTQIASDAI